MSYWNSIRDKFENSSNTLDKYAFKEMLILRIKLILLGTLRYLDLVVEGTMNSFLGWKLPSVTVQKHAKDPRSVEEEKEARREYVGNMKMHYGKEKEISWLWRH
ncbi:hypothetical protein D9758_012324 [Tetrapyrgos nigripes]|uniref:Uncharacterized protein n=1 Tax=Tetrapyrgos nigripes TaxID=182062 RepID=A0A8H5FPU9_9AGAR|nr:hypothetical protein D9758_012324 [Tetrapyrgos nigripes]